MSQVWRETMSDCGHTYQTYDIDRNIVTVKWARMFCPDCGLRLEAPGPNKPFHLKPHQR